VRREKLPTSWVDRGEVVDRDDEAALAGYALDPVAARRRERADHARQPEAHELPEPLRIVTPEAREAEAGQEPLAKWRLQPVRPIHPGRSCADRRCRS
jgi:hypothetical protein